MSSEVRIEVPRDIWPYGPPTVLLEKDIRDLLRELPGLRYGLIESLYPAVYWDTPLARFAVIPVFIQEKLRGYPYGEPHTWFSPKPEAVVVFDVVVNNKRTRILGIPCLLPELGKYVSIPMDAVVVMPRERIYIKPELATFRTEFYGGVQSIYTLVRELLAGEAEKVAEKNIIGCFGFARLLSLRLDRLVTEATEAIIEEAIINHVANTTMIPKERIEWIVHELLGACSIYFEEMFNQYIRDTHVYIPAYQEILSDERAYLQKYLVGEFIIANIAEYREFISMRDLCEGGMNKAYEEVIKGSIIDDIRYRIRGIIDRIIFKIYERMLAPSLPTFTLPFDTWMLEKIMSPEHPFRRRVGEYAESVVRELLEKYLKVEDKPTILTFSVRVRKKYMYYLDRDLEGIVELYPKQIPLRKLKEYFADTLLDLLVDELMYESHIYTPRILTELYDKPIHVLSDLYTSTGDYMALVLHDVLQAFIGFYPYNAWEAVKSRFGIKSVGVSPQRLNSRRQLRLP